ncbi:MAG: beta-galactosidase [Phycisphaerae bacterium]|nr:beta-galactosidase [Phycisphaerae bacterium]
MATVTHDDRCFLVDGKPIWLVSGSVHYFRTPAALWPDRLLKAKRAGLNCIETYVPWNFHEPVEGAWQFSGDHDVAGFVRLAGQMGLYVILRPGPYICSEWDFGGLPGWLTTKPGIAYRTANAAFTHYYDKYFRQVLPRLAELQVTRGGNIILIQNENEYTFTTMPDRLNYLEFISQLIRRYGFEIPIINCNLFSDPPLPDSIETVNAGDGVVQSLKRMRLHQPDRPLLVTEFWPGSFDAWGGSHRTRDARETARRAMEILGCGAQCNYYMFYGGTNFAYWGARLETHQATYQTTSYDFDAPLAEGGGLTEKYYTTRLVNMLANHMGPWFAQAAMDEPGVTLHDTTGVLNTSGPLGRWAIVTNNGRSEITTARLSLPNGKDLTVPLEPLGAAAVPVGLKLNQGLTLDYTNCTPLGLFGERVLVLHGPAGWEVQVSVNGAELRSQVPGGQQPTLVEHQGLVVVLVSSDLAMRTWLVNEALVFGPRFVGETIEDAEPDGTDPYCSLALAEGKLTYHKPKPVSRTPAPPRLSAWQRISVCREPVGRDVAWEKIDRPRTAEALGQPYGYVWYRVDFQDVPPGRKQLFLPDCADRATLYFNGKLLGTWGRGPEAVRTPIPATFRAGKNVLTALVDNLGRMKDGPEFGELKGLYGHIYDAEPVPIKFKLQRAEGFPRRIIPRQHLGAVPTLERLPVWEAVAPVPLMRVTRLHLSFANVPHPLAIMCNERTAGFFPSAHANFGDVTLGAELKKGRNVLKVLLWGDATAGILENFCLYSLNESLSQKARWSFRALALPTRGGHIVGKDQPAWYVAKFTCDERGVPLFLHIAGAKKGQIFVNGHNVGRFWTIGPQEYYYLPACWLQHANELMLFEEQGNIPRRSWLEFRPGGPYRE